MQILPSSRTSFLLEWLHRLIKACGHAFYHILPFPTLSIPLPPHTHTSSKIHLIRETCVQSRMKPTPRRAKKEQPPPMALFLKTSCWGVGGSQKPASILFTQVRATLSPWKGAPLFFKGSICLLTRHSRAHRRVVYAREIWQGQQILKNPILPNYSNQYIPFPPTLASTGFLSLVTKEVLTEAAAWTPGLLWMQ